MMTATEIKQRTRDIANNFVNGSMSTTDWRACIDSPSTAVAVYIQLQNKRNMPKGHGRADFLPALKAAEKLLPGKFDLEAFGRGCGNLTDGEEQR